jgi:hypothetical protein
VALARTTIGFRAVHPILDRRTGQLQDNLQAMTVQLSSVRPLTESTGRAAEGETDERAPAPDRRHHNYLSQPPSTVQSHRDDVCRPR